MEFPCSPELSEIAHSSQIQGIDACEKELSAFHWTQDCCLSPFRDHAGALLWDAADTGEQSSGITKQGLWCYIIEPLAEPTLKPDMYHSFLSYEPTVTSTVYSSLCCLLFLANLKNPYCLMERIIFVIYFSWGTVRLQSNTNNTHGRKWEIACLWLSVASISFLQTLGGSEGGKDRFRKGLSNRQARIQNTHLVMVLSFISLSLLNPPSNHYKSQSQSHHLYNDH